MNTAWNPGLDSEIPGSLKPSITLFRETNAFIDYNEAKELSDLCGLSPTLLCALRPERLVVHELLIRVSADYSVPDDAAYEVLGINMRSMVNVLFEQYVAPNMEQVQAEFDRVRLASNAFLEHAINAALANAQQANLAKIDKKPSKLWQRWFTPSTTPKDTPLTPDTVELDVSALQFWKALQANSNSALEQACLDALLRVCDAMLGHRGKLIADHSLIVKIAKNLVCNRYGSSCIGKAIEPFVLEGALSEAYRALPVQAKPVIMNVKGASASGKSTIRPQQRQLAEKLGIPWEDFALISPDYWRKYLLEYESLGEHYKYGAMLTGHELEIVDKKLDRYMAEKAALGKVPHLLIDRFRFDSFSLVDGRTADSQLLSRFGDRIFMFFMVTSPQETVERAWSRGLSTGRYKAVDDLLYHNVEAYTGMPALFFAWIQAKNKRVHVEFLDNDVPLGQLPKTGAYAQGDLLTVLDINVLLNVDRFRKVNVAAKSAADVFVNKDCSVSANSKFMRNCIRRLPIVRFADRNSKQVYALVKEGVLVWWDHIYINSNAADHQTAAVLSELGYTGSICDMQLPESEAQMLSTEEKNYTFGRWQDG